ncbi:cytochrome C [Geobacter sp. DSM 9736]|uniref:cytochrome C n=1 Tax=Geobacter sp. DSM 9736 TaxID=1277350 RepID=UPI000B6173CB|nr:cytochrome C [Geobacter sp. DSM 9736]SNB47387.1 hypothetical protein SAMN06269301_2874 [Geobacter sp. DSM 9736]
MKPVSLMSLMLLVPLAFTGCGNTTVEVGASSALLDSESCTSCHDTAISRVTGELVAEQWKRSVHATRNGAGCRDCHEPAPGHPNSCWGCHGGIPAPSSRTHDVVQNPDTSLKCLVCHSAQTLGAPHFSTVTVLNAGTAAYPASFADGRYVGNCLACHDPHDPTTEMPLTRQWAASGHGETTAAAWAAHDFKARGTSGAIPAASVAEDCVRCHTTTGYINYVTSGFKNISGWGRQNLVNLPDGNGTPNHFNASDLTKQVLACNGCHDDGSGNAYNWKRLRSVGRVPAYVNYSSRFGKVLINDLLPDLAASNTCVPCHTSRQSGRSIKALETAEAASGVFAVFSSAGGLPFVDAHDMTAGSTVYRTSGYEYVGRDYTNLPHYEHDEIGLRSSGLESNGTGTNGPCIGCHMTSAEGHSLKVVQEENDAAKVLTGGVGITAISSRMCVVCHSGADARTASSMQREKEGFNAALAALAKALKNRGFVFRGNPASFSNKNWQTDRGGIGGFGAGTGGRTLGAAFNFNLLRRDTGAYVHNNIYAKRLIHDSIHWIVNGPNGAVSVENAIRSLPNDPALIFGLDGSTINFDNAVKSAAIAYLLGTDLNPTGTGGARP